jgi:hypothetical protein
MRKESWGKNQTGRIDGEHNQFASALFQPIYGLILPEIHFDQLPADEPGQELCH